ncbi:hypothetical protein [Streptomyces bluensis]|uniref:hypothetical protein n=1 Tax=Streptomyces bluensis TaxID=33897 RepID=UPI00332F97BE
MEPFTTPRLLPWSSPEGKPCFLVPDSGGGYVSRLADDMEAVLLTMAAAVAEHARKVLDDPVSPYTEVRYAGVRLVECLTDVLRVAESRGMRLPVPDTEGTENADGPDGIRQAGDTCDGATGDWAPGERS